MILRTLILMLAAFAATLAVAAEETAVPSPPEGWELRGDAAAGKGVYLQKCALCHGENGDGSGTIKLDPPARDLRDGERMNRRSDWEIYLVIRDGGKVLGQSPKMLPWGNLVSEQELHDLAAFVRSLSEDGAPAQSDPSDTSDPSDSSPLARTPARPTTASTSSATISQLPSGP